MSSTKVEPRFSKTPRPNPKQLENPHLHEARLDPARHRQQKPIPTPCQTEDHFPNRVPQVSLVHSIPDHPLLRSCCVYPPELALSMTTLCSEALPANTVASARKAMAKCRNLAQLVTPAAPRKPTTGGVELLHGKHSPPDDTYPSESVLATPYNHDQTASRLPFHRYSKGAAFHPTLAPLLYNSMIVYHWPRLSATWATTLCALRPRPSSCRTQR